MFSGFAEGELAGLESGCYCGSSAKLLKCMVSYCVIGAVVLGCWLFCRALTGLVCLYLLFGLAESRGR